MPSIVSRYKSDPNTGLQDSVLKTKEEDAQEVAHCEFEDASETLLEEEGIDDEDEHLIKRISESHQAKDMPEEAYVTNPSSAEDMVETRGYRHIHGDRADGSDMAGPQGMYAYDAQPEGFSDVNDGFFEDANDENMLGYSDTQTN
jgi:hypothetical protein